MSTQDTATDFKPITIGYKAVMSVKPDIRIDPEELPAVLQARFQGKGVLVRQGFINSSYLVTIVEDTERLERFLEDTKHEPNRDAIRGLGMRPLADIFVEIRPMLDGAKRSELKGHGASLSAGNNH